MEEKWNNLNFLAEPLSCEDMEELLNTITPKLQELEERNLWDYYVNDDDLPVFINRAFTYMYEIVGRNYLKEWEIYPKQKDFDSLWDIMLEEIKEEKIDIKNTDAIWAITTDKIREKTREILGD